MCVFLHKRDRDVTINDLRWHLINNGEPHPFLTPKVEKLLFEHPRVPYDVLDSAIRDFMTALRIRLSQKDKDGKVIPFTMKPRNSKGIYSFTIPYKYFKYAEYAPKASLPEDPERKAYQTKIMNRCAAEARIHDAREARKTTKRIEGDDVIRVYPTILGEIRVRKRVTVINHDPRLSWNGRDVFILHVPTDIDVKVKPKHNPSGVCALDPGEVVFMTGYGTDGNAYLIGEGASRKLDRRRRIARRLREGYRRILIEVDGKKVPKTEENSEGKTKSVFEKVHPYNPPRKITREPQETLEDVRKKRKEAQRKSNKIRRTRKRLANKAKEYETRARNMMKQMHRDIVKSLLNTYEKIIIPKFSARQVTQKRDANGVWKRKIPKSTARRLIGLGHFSFRQLLINKGGDRVFIGTEQYTSQTCGNCFERHKVGGNREFICPHCGVEMHRDINAAHNILVLNAEEAGISSIDRVPEPCRSFLESPHFEEAHRVDLNSADSYLSS